MSLMRIERNVKAAIQDLISAAQQAENAVEHVQKIVDMPEVQQDAKEAAIAARQAFMDIAKALHDLR